MSESRRSQVGWARSWVQHDPCVINLSRSRSSFPNGPCLPCLHFSRVGFVRWDILNLTGHLCWQLLYIAISRKLLLGHVGDQNCWVMSSQESGISQPSAHPVHPNSDTPLLQDSQAPSTGEGKTGCQDHTGLRRFFGQRSQGRSISAFLWPLL